MSLLSPPPPGSAVTIRLCQTPQDRDAAMRVRFAVFVDEQGVPPELEPDEYDDDALHLLAEDVDSGEVVGTLRIIDKGTGIAKIGRVAILAAYRRGGLGQVLMRAALREARLRHFQTVILDAQTYIIPFYERLGFVAEGPVFDDAGIDHQRMSLSLAENTP